MPISEQKRAEYSEQFHCRLYTAEADALKKVIAAEKITFVEFIRRAIKSYESRSE